MGKVTPFQTVGPYLAIGLRVGLEPMSSREAGDAITIRGRLVDGAGEGISDGVLEFWHPAFDDLGRVATRRDGSFILRTQKPLAVPGPDGTTQAPHFAVRVMGRGILTQFLTRVYFADEPGNENDAVLSLVPPDRRATLIATPKGTSEYHFDVVVQGANETVFFDY